MNEEVKKLAQLLKTPEGLILNLEEKMDKISGKNGVIKKIVQENRKKVERALKEMGFEDGQPKAQEVCRGLIKKAEETDELLFKHFQRPDFSTTAGCQSIIDATKELTGDLRGFYLKEEKARELFELNPPKQIMTNLGYGNNIKQMLKNEDIFELFSALRFAEGSDWVNSVFFKPYADLKRDDFEERKIKIVVLPEKWAEIGEKFMGKKLHHMSHLKELGIVFAIPVRQTNPGETLYMFFMTLHYVYEVNWHARLFKWYSQRPDFAQKVMETLKVETSSLTLPNKNKMSWRIVPAYLAKGDSNDPRLFEPHLSTEAWHYTEVAEAIDRFSQRFSGLGFEFWQGSDTVSEYFPSSDLELEKETLVSFDLFDNGVTLPQKAKFKSKYSFRQQEALWNEIFIQYLGKEKLNEVLIENLDKGFVALSF